MRRTGLVVVPCVLAWTSIAHAAVLSVDTTADSGTGSLRAAIADANLGQGSNTIAINLPAPATIQLLTPLPTLGFMLTITGPGSGELTIRGDGTAPVFTTNGMVQISRVTITAGKGDNGGGIAVTGGSLVLLNSTVTGNTATTAGSGIYSLGTLTIRDSKITGNTVEGNTGPAVYGGGTTTVTDSTIADNAGTAIVFPTPNKTLTINRSTISGNQGGTGIGGLQLQGGTATIIGSTFSGNSGQQAGELAISAGATLSLFDVTVFGTTAPALLGDPGSMITLRNTLLAGTGVRCSAGNVPTSQGHNLSSDATCHLTDTTDKAGADPLLAPLADNGGSTKTHTLLAGSPAANAGGDGASQEATDQRGKVRVQFGAVDIGAVEVTEPVISTQPTAETVDEGDPLTLTVVAMNQNSATTLRYQWRKGGNAIPGATSDMFSKAATEKADAGMYDVLVINDGGSLASAAVAVVVTSAPKAFEEAGGCCSTGGVADSSAVLGLVVAAALVRPRRRRR
jgi:predicted outer membrane repeat protein